MSPATFAEPAVLPEEALYEVVNGQKVELPPMGVRSTWIASALFGFLFPHVQQHKLGHLVMEMLFILDRAANVRRRPDVAFVSAERWPIDRETPWEGDWDVVPDLAVEVVSPNDTFSAVERKIVEYFDHDVRQVWVVSPVEQRIYVYDSPEDVRIVAVSADLESPLLPGWRLPLATLFRAPTS
jgi:Uma2 family endonuclease